MSEYIPAFERCLNRSIPREQQPRAEWMRADRDRIRALEAENERLREALGEAVKYVEWVRECDSADGHGGSVWLADDLLTRLRAAT